MSHLRFRKSPNIRVELLSVISKHKELPMELEHMILDKYTPQLSERTKGDIRKLAKRYSVRMRFRKVQEKYILHSRECLIKRLSVCLKNIEKHLCWL